MKSDRFQNKSNLLEPVIKAFFLLLVAVLIVACATSQEKAPVLPENEAPVSPSPTLTRPTSTKMPPSPTRKQPTASPVTELDFVALGDSRTRSTTWPDLWINSTEADLDVKVNFYNWAFNGRPSEEVLSALRDNEKVINDVENAEIITLFTTDQTGLETFTLNRNLEECPDEAYKTVLEEIVQEIYSIRNGKSTIIRMFEHYNFPGVTERSFVHFEAKNRCIKIYNEVVHSIANKYAIPVVPIYEAFNGSAGNENPADKGYLRDGIHTNPSGDAVIAELLRDLGYDPVIP